MHRAADTQLLPGIIATAGASSIPGKAAKTCAATVKWNPVSSFVNYQSIESFAAHPSAVITIAAAPQRALD